MRRTDRTIATRWVSLKRVGFKPSNACRIVLCLGILASLMLHAAPISAQETVGEWAFKRIDAASKALADNKYGDARAALDRMKGRESRLNPRELALMWQLYGQLSFLQERYAAAVTAYEKAIATGALEEQQANDILFDVGQLNMAQEKWQKAAVAFEKWLKTAKNPSPQARYSICQNYMQLKNWSAALVHGQAAVKGNPKPPEPWLANLGSIQYQLGRKKEFIVTLKRLLDLYPKATYWKQLAGQYGDVGDDKRQLAVYELAYRAGYLEKKSEIKNLAQMMINQGVPFKAADLLSSEMKEERVPRDTEHLKILADAYLQAKEFDEAIVPLGEAARLSKSGELFLQVAQIQSEQENWGKAIQASTSALSAGGLKVPGKAHLVKGIASFYSGKRDAAVSSFNQAKRSSDNTTANVARQWLTVIASLTSQS